MPVKYVRDYLIKCKDKCLLFVCFFFYIRAKIKVIIIIKSVLSVSFVIIPELHNSVSQQTLAIIGLALT
jgi:hypothetical protein